MSNNWIKFSYSQDDHIDETDKKKIPFQSNKSFLTFQIQPQKISDISLFVISYDITIFHCKFDCSGGIFVVGICKQSRNSLGINCDLLDHNAVYTACRL